MRETLFYILHNIHYATYEFHGALLKRLGIEENTPMLIDVTTDGAIVLRQATVLPVEIYSDARIAEFEREGTVSDIEAAAAKRSFADLVEKSSPCESGYWQKVTTDLDTIRADASRLKP